MDRFFRVLWGVAVVSLAVGGAWVAAHRWTSYELGLERRALDARANDLAQRTLTAGSPLACLDAIGNDALEAACEKTLYANPETTAAGLAYIDAKLILLADGLAHVAQDAAYAAKLERLRRALEADRYGMVAQALVSRGCTVEACPSLKLLRNPERVLANIRDRTFDANVVLNAALWRPESAALAAAPAATIAGPVAPGPPSPARPGTPSKYEFPSAASIPPVSIMNAEPPLSKQEEAAIAPPAPARAPAAPPAPVRQKPAANVPLPPPAPAAPR